MAKGGVRVPHAPRTELDALREYANALAPQKGFFSTLDGVIEQAPFERAPISEWRNYLKPGRMLQRDEAQFPLKQEELDWSEIQNIMKGIEAGGYELPPREGQKDFIGVSPESVEKGELLHALRSHRPRFALDVSDETGQLDRMRDLAGPEGSALRGQHSAVRFTGERYGPRFDRRYSHQSPDSVYQESVTRMPEVVNRPQHFANDTLSHSRASSHRLPSGERMRLVEEIQSDLHARAAEPIEDIGPNSEMPFEHHLTDPELEQLEALREVVRASRHPSGRDRSLTVQENLELEAATKRITELQNLAQSRVPRRGYYTQQEFARRNELTSLERMATEDPSGWLDEQAYDLYDMRANLLDEYASTGRLYGYNPDTGRHVDSYQAPEVEPETPSDVYSQIFDQVQKPLRDITDEGERRGGWTPEHAAELQELSRKVERGVADAPFKGAKDYAALELRKQLLDAVNGEQDYLALTTGEDQIQRYGFRDHPLDPDGFGPGPDEDFSKQIAGMQYGYDQLYPSVLKSLARRYGAEIVNLDAPVGSRKDTRPAVMRRLGVEELGDFMAEIDSYDSWHDRMAQMKELPHQLGLTGQPYLDLLGVARKIVDLQEEVRLDDEGTNGELISAEHDKWRTGKLAALRALSNEYHQTLQPLLDARKGPADEANRTFPAMKLTPEVRERIKRLGVPLWSIAGGAVIFDDEEEKPAMAKGGLFDRFRRKKPEPPRAPTGLEQLRRIAEELQAQNKAAQNERVKTNSENPIMRDTEVPRIEGGRRVNPFIEKYGFPPKKKAEGGEVKGSLLNDLGAAFSIMHPDVARGAQQAAHGFRTQWMGRDEKGALHPPLWTDWDAPKDEWEFNSEAQMLLPPTRQTRPGIVDDTIGLPAFFGVGPQASFDAADRSAELDDALRTEYDVPLPETWPDYIGGAAGVMGAQLPLPSGLAKGALGTAAKYVPKVVKTAAGALGRIPGVTTAGKVAGSLPEWFMPTIEPTVGNYATGTAAGAALTKFLPELVENFSDEPEEQAPPGPIDWTNPSLPDVIEEMITAGEITPEEAEDYYRQIDSEVAKLGGIPYSDEEWNGMTTGGGFAKGGRIRLNSETLTEAAKRVQNGQSIAEIADGLGVNYAALYKRLTRAGVSEVRSIPYNRLTPAQRAEALLRTQADESQYKTAEQLGVSQSAISQLKKRAGEIEGHAKGGIIKPTVTKLRQRLADLIAPVPEAGVQGTGQEMVPVEPTAASPPALEQSIPESLSRLEEQLGQVGPKVSRRDVLRGMGHLAGAAMSPAELNPAALLGQPDELAARLEKDMARVTEPASVAKGLDPAILATRLTEAFDWLDPEHSDGPYFDRVRDALKDIPDSDLKEEIMMDLEGMEGDWDSGMIESGEIKDLYETWRGQVAQDIENYAKEQDLIVWARHGDSTDEPMNIMTQRDAAGWEFDNYMGDPELRKGKPQLTDEQYSEGEELFHQLRSGLRRKQQLEASGKLTRALEEEIETEAEQIVQKLDEIGFDSESWGADMDSHGNLGEHY